jgi:hypothetical protein
LLLERVRCAHKTLTKNIHSFKYADGLHTEKKEIEEKLYIFGNETFINKNQMSFFHLEKNLCIWESINFVAFECGC